MAFVMTLPFEATVTTSTPFSGSLSPAFKVSRLPLARTRS